MNILFWNLHEKNLGDLLVKALRSNKYDLLFFSEYQNTDMHEVVTKADSEYQCISSMGGTKRITAICSEKYDVVVLQSNARFVIYRVNIQGTSYLISVVHLSDKRNDSDGIMRENQIRDLVFALHSFELEYKYRSIIIGDFNAEPYDREMLSKFGMNAVLFKKEILKHETVNIDGHRVRRFYNPTLSSISEEVQQYGSYRLDGPVSPIWHCLDQVVMRKAMITYFENVQYLKKIANISLMKDLNPKYSDHLPLLIRFKL